MQTPLRINSKGMAPSPAIEAHIREKAAKLEQFHGRLIGCRVTVEAPHRHHRRGKLYNVRADISVPGRDVFVGYTHPINHANEDVYVAIRDAFNAAGHLLEDHIRRMRGDIKSHEAPIHGRITRLLVDHGFIETSDGQDVYFHRNSVIGGGFEKLDIGDGVRLVIADKESSEGPQATTVRPIGKHHIIG